MVFFAWWLKKRFFQPQKMDTRGPGLPRMHVTHVVQSQKWSSSPLLHLGPYVHTCRGAKDGLEAGEKNPKFLSRQTKSAPNFHLCPIMVLQGVPKAALFLFSARLVNCWHLWQAKRGRKLAPLLLETPCRSLYIRLFCLLREFPFQILRNEFFLWPKNMVILTSKWLHFVTFFPTCRSYWILNPLSHRVSARPA